MGSNDFGGNLVYLVITFAEMQKMKTLWIYHHPKDFGIHILEMWQQYLDLHGVGYQHFSEI